MIKGSILRIRRFKKLLLEAIIISSMGFNSVLSYSNMDEIDYLRQELYCSKSKTTTAYYKNQGRLKHLLKEQNIDYSTEYRLKDVKRLISEGKFNAAMYELNDLIEKRIKLSLANEYIADICELTSKNSKNSKYYYEQAVEYDQNNANANYKLAKIYLKEGSSAIALEYLNNTASATKDKDVLLEIEDIVQNKITPKNKNEANISYETLGKVYYKLNRTKEAYQSYSKALQMNPDDIYIKYILGDLFFIHNQNDNAIAIYNAILKENPSDSQIRTSKAKSLARNGNLLGANKEYDEILSRYPNSMQAKYGIYKIYEKKLPLDKIMEKMQGSNANYEQNYRDYIIFSEFLASIGDNKGRNAFYNYANKIKDETIIAKSNQENAFNSALASKNNLSEPKNRPIKGKKKPLVKEDNITLKEKEQEHKALQDRAYEEKRQIKAKVNEQQQQLNEDAMIAKERAQAINKDPKKYKEYKLTLENYLKIEPKTTEIYIAIANTAKLMGEPTSALRYYREAIKTDPTNSELYYSAGLTYLELNYEQESKKYLQKAVDLDQNNKKAITLLAFVNQKIITHVLNLAYSKYENKQYIEAFEILDKNIKIYPKNAQLYYYRALIFDAMKRNAAQIVDLQKAIELDPTYYMAYYQLGLAYEKIKDERSALVMYEKFLSTEPDEPDLVKEVQRKVEMLGKKFY